MSAMMGILMSFDNIQQLVKSLMGLAPESVGHDTIERVITRRMKSEGIEKVADYYNLVQKSAEERQNLINEITVPETWFFRDHEPFKALSDFAITSKARKGQQRIKVLSIPCSTGEEPYSIAMVLRDAGLKNKDYKIDAVDISTKVLEKARKGVYGDNSFRGKDISFRKRYFEERDGAYAISPEIKRSVEFINSNILDKQFLDGRGPYDVVFCRNLLIYFDFDTKCEVLKILYKLMGEKALLVLGHAETGRLPEGLFQSINLPGTFAYQKVDGANVEKASCAPVAAVKELNLNFPQPRKSKPPVTKQIERPTKVITQQQSSNALAQSEPVINTHEWIGSIQQLANRGELKEALTECDKLIEEVPDSVQGYYLKGVILLAFDADMEAYDAFKKAVYLDPKHYQSLIHLSVLAEEQDDLRSAENYRARANRLRESGHAVDE